MTNKMTKQLATIGAALLISAPAAWATPVNGTGDLVGEVIFGSGNADGGFTGVNVNNIEVALRGKQRYPAANIFNYDGDHTYVFDSSVLTTNPANRSVFNFEFSINVDVSEQSGATIGDFVYLLEVDRDPSLGTDFSNAANSVNPFDANVPKDHSFGDTSTANGAGVEAGSLADWQANLTTYSVAQQSWNLGFESFSGDPDAPGTYTVNLSVFSAVGGPALAATSIDIQVLPLPLPSPATLPLLFGSIGLVGLLSRRRRA